MCDAKTRLERALDIAHHVGVVAGMARAGQELMDEAKPLSLEVREFAARLVGRWLVSAEAMHDGSRAMLDQVKAERGGA